MAKYKDAVKQPGDLSPRVKWLRDYYFEGVKRDWNNEYSAYTTGTPWDIQFDEMTYYIVPEVYSFMSTFTTSVRQAAETIEIPMIFLRRLFLRGRPFLLKKLWLKKCP